jgi:hypothetical protein
MTSRLTSKIHRQAVTANQVITIGLREDLRVESRELVVASIRTLGVPIEDAIWMELDPIRVAAARVMEGL